MKPKQKLAVLNAVQNDLKCVLIGIQRRQLELLDIAAAQIVEAIRDIDVTKQKLEGKK
jgi:hypothetical protein